MHFFGVFSCFFVFFVFGSEIICFSAHEKIEVGQQMLDCFTFLIIFDFFRSSVTGHVARIIFRKMRFVDSIGIFSFVVSGPPLIHFDLLLFFLWATCWPRTA